MAHTKAAGSKARQKGKVIGKRLGVKVYGGEIVRTGQIIIRQRGQTIRPGENVKLAKDYTIFSLTSGVVKYSQYTKDQKKVSVEVPQASPEK